MTETGNQAKRAKMSSPIDETDDEKLLNKLKLEVEVVEVGDKPAEAIKYRPSYRAHLAKKGYLALHTLGTGSYSKVKIARGFNGKPEQAAIKIIDRQKAPSDYLCKFLPRELTIWPKLDHPHIARLYEVFADSRRVFMVLEYAAGGDVLRCIQKTGAMTETAARVWSKQMIDAVHYMHQRDIAHRDLKLENLLIDSEGNIKICDFGFAKSRCSKDVYSRTYCGSRSYACPEILQGRPYCPKRADVWALGVIIYIFMTGRMPFDETKGTKSILAEQKRLGFSFSRTREPISYGCRSLIMATFRWDFNERPQLSQIVSHVWFCGRAAQKPPECTNSRDEVVNLPPIRAYLTNLGARLKRSASDTITSVVRNQRNY